MSIQNPLLPLGIDFKNWASQLLIDLPNVNIPNPAKIDDWRDWASQLLIDNNLPNVPSAHHLLYQGKDGWRSWAKVFISNFN